MFHLKETAKEKYDNFLQFIKRGNRPFPSSLMPLFQNEFKCETFHMKMSSANINLMMSALSVDEMAQCQLL